jgi:hypothetical protein
VDWIHLAQDRNVQLLAFVIMVVNLWVAQKYRSACQPESLNSFQQTCQTRSFFLPEDGSRATSSIKRRQWIMYRVEQTLVRVSHGDHCDQGQLCLCFHLGLHIKALLLETEGMISRYWHSQLCNKWIDFLPSFLCVVRIWSKTHTWHT